MAPRLAIPSIRRAILLVAAIVGLVAGLAPRRAFAQPKEAAAMGPDPAEALPTTPSVALDEYPPPSARRNLLIAGFASTAVWYGGVLAASYAVDNPALAKDLRIPLAGPWISLSHTGCYAPSNNCNTALIVIGAVATVLDGIGQAAGLALAAEGLFMPTQEPKRARAALLSKRYKNFDWRPTFDAGKNSVGFGVVGVF